ncbi:hypothetical protein [Streptomyces sp. FIT100]|uniref:hypothetical protein n=1 Tax=Streptomyces sp. FIT100 TaxID=2837956 RepID=UPI0021C99E4A|nr:hypothetical protein [Streptomyces sp. FIT100]UUN26200.1 hypothetical protein KK483_07030 [Streptomyces sp. FIT100]
MIRAVRLAAALPLLLALSACGTERAGESGGAPAGPVPDRAALEDRVRALESAPELIYVTDVPGFEPAKQSLGPSGHDGFQSTYVRIPGGAQVRLVVDRGELSADTCPAVQVDSAGDAAVVCEQEGDATWYRTAGGRHEYARAEDGHIVRIAADKSVDRATLRTAAEAAHRADDRELDAILPEAVPDAPPVERGDLPPVGDGAPNNDVGASG